MKRPIAWCTATCFSASSPEWHPRLFGEKLCLKGALLLDVFNNPLIERWILKGAAPGDLPLEQVQKLELALNLKTASALGLTIPRLMLMRATRVID